MRSLLCAAALVAFAAPVHAQSTPTEHQAAAPVQQRIDALQARIQPTRLAERLAGAADPARDRMLAHVGEAWTGGLQGLSDWIGKHPEAEWHEE